MDQLKHEQRLPALDGLRGLAILLVLVFHFGNHLAPATPAQILFRRVVDVGWVGVDLFFVVSGFLITGILLDTRQSSGYFSRFYIRRLLRIAPIYYLFIASNVLLLPLLLLEAQPVRDLVDRQWWFWSYTANVMMGLYGDHSAPLFTAAMWSLAIEEQFYLLWPFVVWFSGARLLTVCAVAMVGAEACRVLLWSAYGPSMAVFLMPARMDVIAVGAAIAVLWRSDTGHLASLARSGLLVTAPLMAGALVWGWPSNAAPVIALGGFTVIAVFFGAVVASALIWPTGLWARGVGRVGWLQWLGGYAYGLYIWHNHARLLLLMLGLTPENLTTRGGLGYFAATGIYAGLGFGVSLVFALVSWKLIEAPILSLKRFVPYRKAEDSPLAVA
jgi:peptidoglycan/LPS O-acetylase OafA/YrhL